MQELITEIAIYLGLAAFLGLVLGYLIWGLGQRRRIEAARAEAAAGARTTVDGNSPLRTQIESLTRERDRLEHRVELLSARVASLLESEKAPDDGSDTGERLGTVRMRMADQPGDPMDRAAEAFPRPADAEPADRSIFAPTDEPEAAPAPEAETEPVATGEPARPWHGEGSLGDDAASSAPRGLFIRRRDDDDNGEDDRDSTADGPGDDNDAPVAAEAAAPVGEGSAQESIDPDGADARDSRTPDEPVTDAVSRGLGAAAASLRESLGQIGDVSTGDAAPPDAPHATDDDARAGEAPALLLSSAPETPDDLTRIKGIGKSTEKALNANGIWLFRQLAEMTDEDAEWIRTAIGGLPGRIARDRWSDQARALLDGTGDGT